MSFRDSPSISRLVFATPTTTIPSAMFPLPSWELLLPCRRIKKAPGSAFSNWSLVIPFSVAGTTVSPWAGIRLLQILRAMTGKREGTLSKSLSGRPLAVPWWTTRIFRLFFPRARREFVLSLLVSWSLHLPGWQRHSVCRSVPCNFEHARNTCHIPRHRWPPCFDFQIQKCHRQACWKHLCKFNIVFLPSLRLLTHLQVSYKVSWSAHLKKPIAVGSAFLGLFTLGMIVRRINLTISGQKKKIA